MPDTGKIEKRLQRPHRGLHRLEWSDPDPEMEFHLGHGDLIHLLVKTGFEIVDLIELCAPADAKEHSYYSYVTPDWAALWPSEEIWRVRKP